MNLSTFDLFKHLNAENCFVLDDEQLQALQHLLKEIADDIVDVCESNGIAYSLGGGTALGAVRHQGFIPWDDDVDLNMPRADYERFLPLFMQQMGEKYWIHTPAHTNNYGLLHTRVRRKGTTVKTKEDFFTDECGAMVDIFVIENTFDNVLLRTAHGIGCMAFGLALSCRKFYRDRKYLLPLVRNLPKARSVFRIKICLGFITSVFSLNWWTRIADRWNALCCNNNSRMVVIPSGRKHFWGELYQRSTVCKYQRILFEGRLMNCVADSDVYLKNLYGDYLTPPTEVAREKHVYFLPFAVELSTNPNKE